MVGKGDTPNYYPLFLTVGLFMVISVVILYFTIKENTLRGEIDLEESAEEVPEENKEVQSTVKLP